MKILSPKITEPKLKNLSAKEKNNLKKQAAHRILAGFGVTDYSWNYATTYGFSFDDFRGHSKVYEDLQKFLDKEGIKYTLGAGSMHLRVNISTRGDNLDKFVKLGEKTWEKAVKLYLPLINELERIQDQIDSSTKHKVSRFNYLVSRTCFADYYRNKLLKNEEVYNYEEMIKTWKQILEVQGNINKVLELYRKNKTLGLGKFNPYLANKLEEEYERLTGENLINEI